MNSNEIAACIALLAHSWPGEMTDESIQLWSHDLARYDADMALEALNELRRSTPFRPTLSAFTAAWQSVARRHNQPVTRAITGPHIDAHVQRRMIEGLRVVLRNVDTNHDHRRGADRCPVCSAHDLDAHVTDQHRAGHPECPRCATTAAMFMEATT